jgi:hypothetical protein
MSQTTTHWDVFWRGERIGTVMWPSVDHFHICGRWRPRPGHSLNTFLRTVEDAEEAVVTVANKRGFRGFVSTVPDSEINIKYSVTLNAG